MNKKLKWTTGIVSFVVVSFLFLSVGFVKADLSLKQMLVDGLLDRLEDRLWNELFGEDEVDISLESSQSLGAIGSRALEDYIPLIRYNQGTYTKYPIRTLSSLTLGSGTLAPSVNGTMYWDPDTETIKLYSTAGWVTLGTTTSGFTKAGDVIYFDDTTRRILGLGTTTNPVNGNNILTLAPTTTTSIPFAIYRDHQLQTAPLMKVINEDVAEEINYFQIGSTGQLMVATGTPALLASLTATASTTAGVPFAIKAKESQTGDLMRVLDQDGTIQFVIDAGGELGISTTTVQTNVDLGIGDENATSTIMMGKACFSFDDEAGNAVWYWPCVGNTCGLYNEGAASSGWATSTTPCNDSVGDL